MLGLLGVLRDPAVQRGLDLLVELARGLSECAEAQQARGQPPRGSNSPPGYRA